MNIMNTTQTKREGKNHEWRWSLFHGILPFDTSLLTLDIVAGITLAALGMPEGLQRLQAFVLVPREVRKGSLWS